MNGELASGLPEVALDHGLRFDNRLVQALPGDPEAGTRRRQVENAVWSPVQPTPVAAPRLLAHSAEMAAALGFDTATIMSPAFAEVFGGNAPMPGAMPYASNYGGHQFGHWAGQLGDGRAITLGEGTNAAGERWELQLKGAGPTPYSRTADGRAVLRSSIREFLCSEAMHHLGVPTTRALSLVATGDAVVRDMFYDGHAAPEPGAIVCRVAPSFIRFGHFELPYARGDVALLRQLVEFTIARDFPHLTGAGESLYADWFAEVCMRTATMIAGWMRVGFVHGVMNTDNMSILGLTIDYGPYGWVDDFDPDWTPNTTDAQGRRYRFGWQPRIAHWNLGRLAQALSPLFGHVAPLQAGLDAYASTYAVLDRRNIADKLGLTDAGDADVQLMQRLHGLLQAGEVDMTLFFRGLADLDTRAPSIDVVGDAFYAAGKRDALAAEFEAWLQAYVARIEAGGEPPDRRRQRMRAVNPRYVPRNYLAQQVIDAATQGDVAPIGALLEVLRHPYADQPGHEQFAGRRPEWARTKAGCSMLSCSS